LQFLFGKKKAKHAIVGIWIWNWGLELGFGFEIWDLVFGFWIWGFGVLIWLFVPRGFLKREDGGWGWVGGKNKRPVRFCFKAYRISPSIVL